MASVAIIINGISRKKKKFYKEIYPTLAGQYQTEVLETKHAGHATTLAEDACRRRFDFVIAAGGDGTLNQVLNGVMRGSGEFAPTLGLVPLGTGNDFARMCGITTHSLPSLLEANAPRRLDVGSISCHDTNGAATQRYFINACSVGMGPAVVQRLENSNRWMGASLTYWKTITATFFTHRPQQVSCLAPNWQWRGNIRVLAIANGRSFGHGIYIAPDAIPDDGLFNTFIAGDLPLWKFLIYQQSLKSTKKINDISIVYNTATGVELTSPSTCPIEAEGELAGVLPARVQFAERKINFLQ